MTSGGNNFIDFPKKSTDQKSPKSPNLDQNLEAYANRAIQRIDS